ncbi:glutathione S-transferase family protein [Pacificimonas sp. WHA3]|uniref:Glutathione S-transferase family protein n=1 Tax=Pacificimonas pallii TaxID=2827236 RepID=A0ABS6SBW9_9SPHN|nr:glutathione S-transferase family protein [Pacificimonas pallii]MBV7255406.1 glutathione S-transferase family protein [Pacificimonas pallii]
MHVKPKLYHCQGARSFRPLWALEEMGLQYELIMVPFPPRVREEGWLDINPFGTIPAFFDNGEVMTESVAICHYLAERHGPTELSVSPNEKDYGRYLNWMYQADATMTFPQTIALRYRMFEPEKGLQQAGDDYTQWFFSRLKAAAEMLGDREFVAAERFTMADIAFGYALKLAAQLKLGAFPENVTAYWNGLKARGAYQAAMAKEAAK